MLDKDDDLVKLVNTLLIRQSQLRFCVSMGAFGILEKQCKNCFFNY